MFWVVQIDTVELRSTCERWQKLLNRNKLLWGTDSYGVVQIVKGWCKTKIIS